MKTMIFWTKKGCRKPKMRGSATAQCSTLTINDFFRMAREKKGYLHIVEAENAAAGRDLIAKHKRGECPAGVVSVLHDGRVVAIGARAVAAISGASHSAAHWDDRIASRGRVSVRESRALQPGSDGFETLTPAGAFGHGLGEPWKGGNDER